MKKLIAFLTLASLLFANSYKSGDTYIGLAPAFLNEPYDSVDALEVNALPITYEYYFSDNSGLHLRPIINLRFINNQATTISHIGSTIGYNFYFPMSESWVWIAGVMSTYTYNLQDIQTVITTGGELGGLVDFEDGFLLRFTLQPGINYYPDQRSRDLAGATTGFLPHFGFIVDFGWAF